MFISTKDLDRSREKSQLKIVFFTGNTLILFPRLKNKSKCEKLKREKKKLFVAYQIYIELIVFWFSIQFPYL